MPWLFIAAAVAMAPAIGHAERDPDSPPSDGKLTLSLAVGGAYLHESWNPNDGNPGSTQTGWAPALEIAVGRVVSPRLVVGGLCWIASFFSPSESFAGTDYHLVEVAKLVSLIGPFVEGPRLPRTPLRAGIAIGAVVSSLVDTTVYRTETTVSLAASPYLGYKRRLSTRWSLGAIARATLYRGILGDTPSSAATTGLLTSFLVTFAFR